MMFIRVQCCSFSGTTNLAKMEEVDRSKAGDVVVGDRRSLQKKISAIQMAGPAKLQVLLLHSLSTSFFSILSAKIKTLGISPR